MKILREKVKRLGVPVTITFNSLTYSPNQIRLIVGYIRELAELGFRDVIVADWNLILTLLREQVACNLHLSGEVGEWNRETLRLLSMEMHGEACRITRIIFLRKNTIAEMKRLVSAGLELGLCSEFEAFLMNERCHYTGGFCNSLHADEMLHLCQLEYRLAPVEETAFEAKHRDEDDEGEATSEQSGESVDGEMLGTSGCGLCALWQLRDAGITHLKIVGRGASAECVARDVSAVKQALAMLTDVETEEHFQKNMRETFYPNGCPNNCYYNL